MTRSYGRRGKGPPGLWAFKRLQREQIVMGFKIAGVGVFFGGSSFSPSSLVPPIFRKCLSADTTKLGPLKILLGLKMDECGSSAEELVGRGEIPGKELQYCRAY